MSGVQLGVDLCFGCNPVLHFISRSKPPAFGKKISRSGDHLITLFR